MENGNIHLFAEMENGNGKFHLGAANRDGQQKMVFLGRQMRNGNRQLLFHQMYPFTVCSYRARILPPA